MTTFAKIADIINRRTGMSVTGPDIKNAVFDVGDGTSDVEQQEWLDESTDDDIAEWCEPILEYQKSECE